MIPLVSFMKDNFTFLVCLRIISGLTLRSFTTRNQIIFKSSDLLHEKEKNFDITDVITVTY